MNKGLKVIIWLVVIALIVWGAWALFFNNGEEEIDTGEVDGIQTVQEGYLIMGTNAAFPPFEFRSDAEYAVDGVAGVDIEIAKAIADELGLTLRVVDMEFGALILSVLNAEIDLAIAGMTITEERAQSVDFSIPYYTAAQVIITAEGTEIASAEDLYGLHVAAVINYTGDFIVSDMEEEGTVGNVLRATTPANAVMELIAGRVDAVVLDSSTAAALVAQNEGLVIVEDSAAFSNENYGIAIRQGNTELLNAVNSVLRRMIASGEIEEIVTRFTLAD